MSTDGARLPAPGSASGAASSHALGAASSHAPGAGDRLAEAVAVMARIRRDGDWESAQTHASLLPYLVEESWELVDAVADGDRDELVSELGDLLLQVLFHAAIGAERAEGSFDIQDVAGSLLDKLRRRAPYWFDDDKTDKTDNNENDDDDNYSVTEDGDLIGGTRTAFRVGAHPRVGGMDAAEQDRLWQLAKAAERAHRPSRGVLDGIPWGMPALALGQKALSRALSAGVPADLIPAQMRIVRVEPAGLFSERGTEAEDESEDDSGSAEVAYRQVVRRFARDLRQAESRLPVPAAEAGPEEWRAAWPTRPS